MSRKLLRLTILASACLALFACARVETALNETKPPINTPAPIQTPEPVRPSIKLKPVVPEMKFGTKQKRYLDESLPPEARKILESAESFEVFGEVEKDESTEADTRTFVPNTVARIASEKQKKEILDAFYFDAAHEDAPAACYEPHHSLKATSKGKTVEIEICFSCSRFEVKGLTSRFWGTIVRENRKSEDLLTMILKESGVEIDR